MRDRRRRLEIFIPAVVTALAGVAGVLYATHATVQEMHAGLGVQTLMKFADDFDSSALERSRADAARELLAGSASHENLDDVLDFFELLGLLVRKKIVDLDLAWEPSRTRWTGTRARARR